MGDLHMANYTCDDHASQVIEVGGEITTRSPQCAAYCNHRLAEVRNDTCGIPCAKVPTCGACRRRHRRRRRRRARCTARRTAARCRCRAARRCCSSRRNSATVRAAERLRGRGSSTADPGTADVAPPPFDGSSTWPPWRRRRRRCAAAARQRGRVRRRAARFLALCPPAPDLPLVAPRSATTSARRSARRCRAAADARGRRRPWRRALLGQGARPVARGARGPRALEHELARRAARDPSRGTARGARAPVPLLKLITLTYGLSRPSGSSALRDRRCARDRVGVVGRRLVVDKRRAPFLLAVLRALPGGRARAGVG